MEIAQSEKEKNRIMEQPITNPSIQYTKIFINNEFVDSKSGKSFEVVNPATEKVIAQVQEGNKDDINIAVKAAQDAFKEGSAWRETAPANRGILLNRLADLLERDRTLVASIECIDSGKKYRDAYGEVGMAQQWLRYFAGLSDKVVGQTGPVESDTFIYSRLEPVGVCGLIIPWNFPLVIFCQKISPCLAAGCTCVIKPAEQTPLSALYMCKLIKEVGFPPGVVNCVPGFGPTAGAAISNHMNINKVSFTGSTEVGRIIMQASGTSNLKRVTLELGGKSPNIVFSDVDLEFAVEQAHQAVMTNMGQICCAGSRTYVHADVYDDFVRRSVSRASRRTVGNPFSDSVEQGPQIDETQFNKILDLIESGKKEGASLLCGGARKGDEGFFIQPTVFADVTNKMRIAREEIFGPVQSIFKFSTIEEVIELANDTHYGLAAAVFTKDINKAIRIANSVQAGTVWVNTYNVLRPDAPFGGFKMSGLGRENGIDSIKTYCETKTVTIGLH